VSGGTKHRVVEEARRWIGTPYVNQAACRGAGSDCLGLIRGVWRALHDGQEPEAVPPYSADWSEAAGDERLWRAAQRHLSAKPVSAAEIGDVLLFRMRSGGVAKHLGIASRIGPAPHFIHAFSGHAVCESALTRPWARRVVARFSFPDRSS